MARIKEKEELTQETVAVAEATAETVTEQKETEAVAEAQAETAATETKEAVEPTGAVLAVLKKFPNLQEAYVTATGSIYTKNTPARIVSKAKAVLYKNPYFNQ